MREIVSPLSGFASPFGPQRGFNPSRIFSNSEPGVWFEANDSTTLFTDVAGTTPVTTPGDAVALQLDKSQGLTLGPELVDADLNTLFADRAEITATATEILFDTTVGDQISSTLGGSIASGSTYEVSFEVFDVVSGGAVLRLGSNAISDTASLTAGSYSFKLNADGTQITFRTGQPDTELKIRNISVKELPGNHRTQATTAARPLYALHPVGGVRNKLEYTEEFDNAVWVKTEVTPTQVDGAEWEISDSGVSSAHSVRFTPQTNLPAGTYSFAVEAKADTLDHICLHASISSGRATASFDLSDGSVRETRFATNGSASSASIEDLGGGWYKCIVTVVASAVVNSVEFQTDNGIATLDGSGCVYVGSGQSIFVRKPQLEEGSTATNYQRVGSFLDVSEEGKARRGRIWYNGTSHFMETGTITPGTDKVQVFAGVRKLSDAATGFVLQHSSSFAQNNGTFALVVPSNTAPVRSQFVSKGTSIASIQTTLVGVAPVSQSYTALGDISGDTATLRIDGTQVNQSTADQGTGNFLAYPIYFGARGGTSIFFNGYEDTSIVRFGPNLDDSVIGKVESYVASKTPEPTL